MPKQKSKKPDTSKAAALPFEAMTNGINVNQVMMESLRTMQATNAAGIQRINNEMLRFAIERLQEDQERLREMATPRDPATVAALWGSYFAMTAQEYAVEARRLWGEYFAEVFEGFDKARGEMQEALGVADTEEIMKSVPV